MEKLQRFRFEAAVQDVTETNTSWLKNEFKSILESNKPYQSKADYIGYSLLSIEEKISILDEEISSLKEYKEKLKKAKAIALVTGAEVFNEYGITKLEGAGISSLTLSSALRTVKIEVADIYNEEALIQQGYYKKVLDEKAIVQAYKDGTYKEFILKHADISVVEYITPSKLRVNKRKATNNDIDIPNIDIA